MIGVTLNLTGAKELIGRSNRIRSLIGRTTLNAIRRPIRRGITTIKGEMRRSSSIGKRVHAAGKSRFMLAGVKEIRPEITADSIDTGIKLTGLPRLIEQGGRTRAHVIRGKPWLVFKVGGQQVFAKKVNHPGAQVGAHKYAEREVSRLVPRIVEEVDKALGALVGNERGLEP